MERIMKKNKIFSMGVALAIGAGATFTSCVDTDSNLVDFGSALNTPNDTVYSLLGVLNKMQAIADRTIILGEVKGDMTSLTDAATTDLQEIANFTAGTDNPYNRPEDYYAIRLNDTKVIPDVINKLRNYYPKILELRRVGEIQELKVEENKERDLTDPMKLVSDFFTEVTGEKLTSNQQKWVENALKDVNKK